MIASTQRWGRFFIAFVLAILVSVGLRPDRHTRVFADSPIGHASYLDLSRLGVPAVKPTKFSFHQEEARRVAHHEPLTSPSKLSPENAPLQTVDTGPPLIDLHGPPVLVPTARRVEVARPAGPVDPQMGGKPPSELAKTGLRQESWFCNM